MSVRASFVAASAGLMLSVSIPAAFAVSPPAQHFFAEGNAGRSCALAAAASENGAAATDRDLASCTAAIELTRRNMANGYAEALTNRGVLHLVRSEYDDAIADSTAALRIDTNLAEARVNRGIALMHRHQLKDAIEDFTTALRVAPAHAEIVYLNRAMAREDSGDLTGAYLDYRTAGELNPGWDRPKQELSRFTVVPKKPIS
ncbi:MAG TPA: tetratricopeptide repeat protein [Micropepsaceae bacterium]|nr:tetratricopeptide repeat protein [Micropepsaceae bacterium]